MAEKTNAAETATVFTKKQLTGSRRYASRRDILNVLLEDGKTYTFDQADKLIDKFMKGKVK